MVQHPLPTSTLLKLLTMVWNAIFYHRNFSKISNIGGGQNNFGHQVSICRNIVKKSRKSLKYRLKGDKSVKKSCYYFGEFFNNIDRYIGSFVDFSGNFSIFLVSKLLVFFWSVNSWSCVFMTPQGPFKFPCPTRHKFHAKILKWKNYNNNNEVLIFYKLELIWLDK